MNATTSCNGTRLSAAALLKMDPSDVPGAMANLDEVNRYALAMAAASVSVARVLTDAEADAFAAMFKCLGPARLKLTVLNLCMPTATTTARQSFVKIHGRIAEHITLRIFNVPCGEAGIGKKPILGVTDSDAFDLHVMQLMPGALADFYTRRLERARLAGTIIIDETV